MRASVPNPIINPSFDPAGGGWESYQSTACTAELGVQYDPAGHDGSGGAAKMEISDVLAGNGCDPQRHARLTEQFTVSANTQAYLSFWYKGGGGYNTAFAVGLGNATTGENITLDIGDVAYTPTTPWTQQRSRLLNLPPGTYRLTFTFSGSGYIGKTAYIDEVTLMGSDPPPPAPPAPAYANPIANPSFENVDGIGYGWEPYFTTQCTAEWGALYDAAGHDGVGGAGKLYIPPYYNGNGCDPQRTSRLTQRFTLVSAARTALSFWYKGGGGYNTALAVRLSDATTGVGVDLGLGEIAYSPTTPWTRATSRLIDLPAGNYRIEFSFGGSGYIGKTAYIDEVTLDTAYVAQHDGSPCASYSAFVADPVNVVFGNFVEQQQDFAVPGVGAALGLTRSYNSANPSDGSFGFGWSYPYGMSVASESPTTMLVRNADCRLDRFTDAGGGNYTAPPGVDNQLVKNGDGTYTLTTPAQTVYSFDTNGRLVGQHDRYGNAVTLAYTATTLTVTDPAGRGFTLTYGTGANAGRFISLTEVGGAGRTVGYGYSAAGDLTDVTNVRGGLTHLTYDAAHQLLTVVDPRGVTITTNVYDTAGRVTEQRDAQNKKTTLAYDTTARQTTVRDDAGTVVGTYGWDTGNRVPTLVDGAGNTTLRTFDANNRLTCVADPTGGRTAYTYDARGNVTGIVDPLNTDANCARKAGGAATTLTYTAANQPLVITDPLGHATTYGYDARGYLTTVTNALNQTTTYTYVAVPLTAGGSTTLVATVTDPLGHTTTYTYGDC